MKKWAVVLVVLLLVLPVHLPLAHVQEVPNVEITKKMMEEAIIAEDTIEIEMEEIEESAVWEKYLYLDVTQELTENEQTFWGRVGTRKENFDISVGWSQNFNEISVEKKDRGTISVSASWWW